MHKIRIFWRPLTLLCLATFAMHGMEPAQAENRSPDSRPLRFSIGFHQDKTSASYLYFKRYLTALCAEAKQNCEATGSIPYQRALRMMQLGELDGEIAHVKTFPNEQGVAEYYLPLNFPVLRNHLHAYTLNGQDTVESWEDFRQSPRRVGYLRGIKTTETLLSRMKPNVIPVPINFEMQCLFMLEKKRLESCV